MLRSPVWISVLAIGCGDGASAKPDAAQVDAARDASNTPDAAPDAPAITPNDCLEPSVASGALRSRFGNGGELDINPSPYSDSIDFALMLDGQDLYVAGADRSGGPDNSQIHIEKRNRCTGELVAAFGAGGVASANIGAADDAVGIAAIAGGSLYLVGAEGAAAPDFAWRIEKRSASTGALDPAFGIDGAVTHNPSGFVDVALFAVIDSQHIYIAGFDSVAGPSDQTWRIEKRQLSDGALVAGFGTAGVILNNPSAGRDMVYGLAIDADSLYIIGSDAVPGNEQWRIEKRSLGDGALDVTFGTGGVITFNPSPGPERVFGIALQTPHMYITGVDGSPGFGDYALRIEKRMMSDGALVTSFGTAGAATTNPSAGLDVFRDLSVDADAIYLSGYDYTAGGVDAQWRIEKRSLSDGTLVPSFGSGGIITDNFTDGDEWAFQILVDTSSIYVLGDYKAAQPEDYGWHLQRRAK